MMSKDLNEIPICDIRVVNPRTRNKQNFKGVMSNIAAVGLKKPITVAKRVSSEGSMKYDLVCGQGRMEALLALGRRTIPANVIEGSREDQLLMSLVENIARRPPTNKDLFREVVVLRNRGYDAKTIAAKLGRETSYVAAMFRLIDQDKADLIEAVEGNRMPLSIALRIASTPEPDIQVALSQAYESGELRGARFKAIKRILAKHSAQYLEVGKPHQEPVLTGRDLVREYERRTKEQQALVKRAAQVREKLLLLRSVMKTLLADEHLLTLLRSENLREIPADLASV